MVIAAASVLSGLAAYLLGPWLLRRIPEPELAEDEVKTPYADLAGRSALWCGVLAATGAGLLAWRLGWSAGLPAWLVLAVAGAVLGYIDIRTKYLPSAIIWPTYGVVAVLLVVAALGTGEWDRLGRAGLAGLGTFGLFYLLWWVYPAGVGFGDVRLSGLLGGALGWLGWAHVVVGVYGGFVLGAVLGAGLSIARVVDRRAFAFGPFMLAGALLGVLVGGHVGAFYS